jgi:hypothetical protein
MWMGNQGHEHTIDFPRFQKNKIKNKKKSQKKEEKN